MILYCPEQLALLKAIGDNPKEDTPRLMYADYLEENPELDPGRAELIRVQCGVASNQSKCCDAEGTLYNQFGGKYDCPKCGGTGERSREIVAAHDARWRIADCPRCYNLRKAGMKIIECPRCHGNGTGDVGGLLRMFQYDLPGEDAFGNDELVRVHFDRGFISRVDVPTLTDCLNRDDSGLDGPRGPSNWLHAVLTAIPERAIITEVVPLDREPYHVTYSTPPTNFWRWWCYRDTTYAPDEHLQASLPQSIYLLLREKHPFTTRDIAVSVLGESIVQFTRG